MNGLHRIEIFLLLIASLCVANAATTVRGEGDGDGDGEITRYPFVLIPGDGGNMLHAKIDKQVVPEFYCKHKTADYFLLWFNLEETLPFEIDCFVDNIKLHYDNKTRHNANTPGVTVAVRGFGDTTTVEYVSNIEIQATKYFATLIDTLVDSYGYRRGKNVRAATYDWRFPPNEQRAYYLKLRSLVEQTYRVNKGTRVILLAHSMGNPVTLYFLNTFVSQAWKDKYLRSFVSMSGVWAGSTKIVYTLSSGYPLGIPLLDPLKAREIQRSQASNIFLLPTDKFWQSNETLVDTPERNYTVADYKQWFQDIGYQQGYQIYEDTRDLIYTLEPPRVETHVLYGHNVSTAASYVYRKQAQFPDTQPEMVWGDGDGTVNIRSLLAFQKWRAEQTQPVVGKSFVNVEHTQILTNADTIAYVTSLLYD